MHNDSAPQTASPSTTQHPRPASGQQPPEVMRPLWARMTEIYGTRWTGGYGDKFDGPAGETWAKGLSGLRYKQIKQGISACLLGTLAWPPTLPEFRALCIGIPTLDNVRTHLHMQNPTPFIRAVLSRLDTYLLRTASKENGDRMIAAAYTAAREHAMVHGLDYEAPVQIAPPKPPPTPTEFEVSCLRAEKAISAAALAHHFGVALPPGVLGSYVPREIAQAYDEISPAFPGERKAYAQQLVMTGQFVAPDDLGTSPWQILAGQLSQILMPRYGAAAAAGKDLREVIIEDARRLGFFDPPPNQPQPGDIDPDEIPC